MSWHFEIASFEDYKNPIQKLQEVLDRISASERFMDIQEVVIYTDWSTKVVDWDFTSSEAHLPSREELFRRLQQYMGMIS